MGFIMKLNNNSKPLSDFEKIKIGSFSQIVIITIMTKLIL